MLCVHVVNNREEGGTAVEGEQKKEEGQEGEKKEGGDAEEDKEITYEEYMAQKNKVKHW